MHTAAAALTGSGCLELLPSKVVTSDLFITQTFPLEKIEDNLCRQRDDSSDEIKMVMVKE